MPISVISGAVGIMGEWKRGDMTLGTGVEPLK